MKFERIEALKEDIVFAALESAVFKGSRLRLDVMCPPGDRKWTGLLVGYSYKIESDREDYFVEPVSVSDAGFGTLLSCEIDVEEFPFRPTNWHVCAVSEKDGERFVSKIQVPAQKFTRPLPKELLKFDYSCFDKSGHIVFTCLTRGGYLGIRYRERTKYDEREIKRREVKAVKQATEEKLSLQRKNICLIYEKRCGKAQDNGYYLFKYCMDNGMEKQLGRSIYYVITEDSPDLKKLEPYRDNVIIFGSVKHMVYLLSATLLISSDARNHGYIWQYDRSLIGPKMSSKKFVFLGHGVLALKKLNESFLAPRMNAVLTTVTSAAEADIVVRELGYKKNDAVVTGYARFDALQDRSDDYREILIMPTHRSWLFGVDRQTFVSSEYFRRYMELINSPELISMLKENGLTANFYLHPSIGEHFDAFSSSDGHVRLIPMGSVPLDDLMMRSSLLITDYSSVCWDLYYMGKPVIFYQYDVQDYLDTWGSYIDLEKDTPGNRADELPELLGLIKQSIDLGFRLDEYWESRRKDHYRYIDRDNCRRICEVLKERGL